MVVCTMLYLPTVPTLSLVRKLTSHGGTPWTNPYGDAKMVVDHQAASSLACWPAMVFRYFRSHLGPGSLLGACHNPWEMHRGSPSQKRKLLHIKGNWHINGGENSLVVNHLCPDVGPTSDDSTKNGAVEGDLPTSTSV